MDVTAETVPRQKIDYCRNTPLSKDEQVLAEKYYNFALIRIKGYINGVFGAYVRNGTVSADDLESAALLWYIKSIKALIVSLNDEKKNFSAEKDADMFICAWISKTVKRAMTSEVRKAAAEKRKVYSVAYSLDAPVQDDSGECTGYDIIPAEEQSAEQKTEFKLLLDSLYKVLTPAQIKACKMLMNGYGIKSIIDSKIAEHSDIGYIRSYLRQLLDFGYVKFRIEDCKRKNVSFDGVTGKWDVRIYFRKKVYFLSKYYDFEIATAAAEKAERHCIKGDFEQWYEKHINGKEFVFSTDSGKDDDENLPVPTDKSRHSLSYSDISSGRFPGVCYNKQRGNYDVSVGSRRIAYGLDKDKAVSLRLEAEEHIRNGDFEQWFTEIKAKAPSKQPVFTHVYYLKSNNTYAVRFKSRYIFKSKDYDKALKFQEDADTHIKEGDFDKWIKKIKTKRTREKAISN